MKTKLFLLAVSSLFLFSLATYAQQMQGPPNFAQMRSPAMQAMMKNGMKAGLRTFWDGRGGNLMALGLMHDPDIRTALGVSNEQFQDIQGIQQSLPRELQKHPEFQKIMGEMQALGDPRTLFGENVDEATRTKAQEIQGKMASLSIEIMSDAIGNAITPEQKKKMNESLLANMSEMPMLSPSMFEVLDLTDAQKQQMEGIKKELEPAFEKNLEEFTSGSMLVAGKAFDELEKQGGDFTNPADVQKKMIDITKKLEAEDPEFKKIQQDLQTKGKAFAMQFHTKMFDVLNDEQWKRLQNLIDNPPEYAKAFGKKIREQKAATDKAGAWQPGPSSWKPGDAIPEQYRQERNEKRRFPKTEE